MIFVSCETIGNMPQFCQFGGMAVRQERLRHNGDPKGGLEKSAIAFTGLSEFGDKQQPLSSFI